MDEVVTFFATRGLHEKAVEAGEWLVSSSSIDVVWVDEAIFHDGFEYLRRRGDKQYSLADCISFVVMESLEGDALAFDAHFERAGFRRLPGR